jgi:hypothetical protein
MISRILFIIDFKLNFETHLMIEYISHLPQSTQSWWLDGELNHNVSLSLVLTTSTALMPCYVRMNNVPSKCSASSIPVRNDLGVVDSSNTCNLP